MTELPCPKCANTHTSMRYCDGYRRQVPDRDLNCRQGDPEHFHRACRRCGYRWRTDDVIGAHVVCPDFRTAAAGSESNEGDQTVLPTRCPPEPEEGTDG